MADNVIILAGGQGKRMKSEKPKVLCSVLGEPMLEWVISACEDSGINDICVVKGYQGQYIDEYLCARHGKARITTVEQKERLGTGHAVMQAGVQRATVRREAKYKWQTFVRTAASR